MHVLIVTQHFWPENFRINDLAAGLVERGHQVTVLTGIPNYPAGRFFPGYGVFKRTREEYKGARILRLPLVPRGKGGGVRLAINYLSFALSSIMLSPFLCRGKFDLIVVCQLTPVTVGLPALFLKKIKGIPILFWILDLWPESLSATGAIRSVWILAQVDRLVRFIYRGCDRIVVASKGFLPSVIAKGIAGEKTDYFPNWYEAEYRSQPGQDDATISADMPVGFRVMFAGNIGVAQDFGTILSAAEMLKQHQDIYWVILGDGRQFEWVKEQVKLRNIGDRVLLLGRHAPDTMIGFFAQADAMLVTLRKDPVFALTVPGKIQSYLACGRPIVASLDGEGAQLVKESGAGFATPSGDAEGLAHSVMTMYRMPKAEREAMGARGKVYCEANFEREMLFDRLEGWMQELR
ncbi:MAG: glycosyltransferase family 4 protein [Verrucomicrobiota bacterium]